MIAHLNGILKEKTPRSVIVDNAGIGYEVFIPLSTFYALPEKEETVSLHIHTYVREDALNLFGFNTSLEKEIFMMLISVTGIGPRLAINILSGIGPGELLEAMARGDATHLQSIPGVGRKTAERIALELREKALKIKGDSEVIPSPVISGDDKKVREEAISALLNLGYPTKSARNAVERACGSIKDINLETLIKEALKVLA
ncbi:MAG: Holliday junction branch migration protein RuvA [Deltaproteobacteria bacterium]|nr:Holliday junction branch migration protein RuvA [Deltaproteobacteria bacterium]MBW1919335.1 Holliday junction branch migration protein RuvA [Deltaproteobacteria bacterium]MBW1936402.1 Holliday junction branch migration protein RuvA [Deltaproteobacteria bacterium]MBW1978824.1 Holliday junction branch migration protein RuvA [Deltaproteobacteria bacterium]MBW2045166.1 Holliday junction branch migration protein RuvA [Deltaproteobacteria bacterium]